jgi:hypothetical protein
MAVENPAGLISEFVAALQPSTLARAVQHNHQPAPHKGKPLPSEQCAVYVFTLSSKYGAATSAGANRALKVGKPGFFCVVSTPVSIGAGGGVVCAGGGVAVDCFAVARESLVLVDTADSFDCGAISRTIFGNYRGTS